MGRNVEVPPLPVQGRQTKRPGSLSSSPVGTKPCQKMPTTRGRNNSVSAQHNKNNIINSDYSDLTHEDSDIIQEDLDLIKEDSDLLQQDIPDLSQQQHHNCPTNHHYEAAHGCAQHKKQKPSHAYSTPWGTTATLPPYLP